jgi:hypothetical protein
MFAHLYLWWSIRSRGLQEAHLCSGNKEDPHKIDSTLQARTKEIEDELRSGAVYVLVLWRTAALGNQSRMHVACATFAISTATFPAGILRPGAAPVDHRQSERPQQPRRHGKNLGAKDVAMCWP